MQLAVRATLPFHFIRITGFVLAIPLCIWAQAAFAQAAFAQAAFAQAIVSTGGAHGRCAAFRVFRIR